MAQETPDPTGLIPAIMSDHIDRTHLINAIRSVEKRRELIERCALDDIDAQILNKCEACKKSKNRGAVNSAIFFIIWKWER